MNTSTITIIAGSKKFTTLRTTLTPAKYFEDKLNDDTPTLTINISPSSFANILNHLRHPTVCPIKYQYRSEADHILHNHPLHPINVGGKQFLLSEPLLKKMDYFKALLTNWKQSIQTEEIFIDNNPDTFSIILRHLTDPKYSIPSYLKHCSQFSNDLYYYGLTIPGINEDEILSDPKPKTKFAHDNAYLTANPEITFFKTIYRRNTYFDFEYKKYSTKIDYNKLNSGESVIVSLPSNIFPMIAAMYIIVDITVVTEFNSSSDDIKWIDHVEPFIFEYISIKIDGTQIDSFTSEARYIHDMINIYHHPLHTEYTPPPTIENHNTI